MDLQENLIASLSSRGTAMKKLPGSSVSSSHMTRQAAITEAQTAAADWASALYDKVERTGETLTSDMFAEFVANSGLLPSPSPSPSRANQSGSSSEGDGRPESASAYIEDSGYSENSQQTSQEEIQKSRRKEELHGAMAEPSKKTESREIESMRAEGVLGGESRVTEDMCTKIWLESARLSQAENAVQRILNNGRDSETSCYSSDESSEDISSKNIEWTRRTIEMPSLLHRIDPEGNGSDSDDYTKNEDRSAKKNTPLLLHRIEPEGNGSDIDESDESYSSNYSSESSSQGDDYSDESELNPDDDERTQVSSLSNESSGVVIEGNIINQQSNEVGKQGTPMNPVPTLAELAVEQKSPTLPLLGLFDARSPSSPNGELPDPFGFTKRVIEKQRPDVDALPEEVDYDERLVVVEPKGEELVLARMDQLEATIERLTTVVNHAKPFYVSPPRHGILEHSERISRPRRPRPLTGKKEAKNQGGKPSSISKMRRRWSVPSLQGHVKPTPPSANKLKARKRPSPKSALPYARPPPTGSLRTTEDQVVQNFHNQRKYTENKNILSHSIRPHDNPHRDESILESVRKTVKPVAAKTPSQHETFERSQVAESLDVTVDGSLPHSRDQATSIASESEGNRLQVQLVLLRSPEESKPASDQQKVEQEIDFKPNDRDDIDLILDAVGSGPPKDDEFGGIWDTLSCRQDQLQRRQNETKKQANKRPMSAAITTKLGTADHLADFTMRLVCPNTDALDVKLVAGLIRLGNVYVKDRFEYAVSFHELIAANFVEEDSKEERDTSAALESENTITDEDHCGNLDTAWRPSSWTGKLVSFIARIDNWVVNALKALFDGAERFTRPLLALFGNIVWARRSSALHVINSIARSKLRSIARETERNVFRDKGLGTSLGEIGARYFGKVDSAAAKKYTIGANLFNLMIDNVIRESSTGSFSLEGGSDLAELRKAILAAILWLLNLAAEPIFLRKVRKAVKKTGGLFRAAPLKDVLETANGLSMDVTTKEVNIDGTRCGVSYDDAASLARGYDALASFFPPLSVKNTFHPSFDARSKSAGYRYILMTTLHVDARNINWGQVLDDPETRREWDTVVNEFCSSLPAKTSVEWGSILPTVPRILLVNEELREKPFAFISEIQIMHHEYLKMRHDNRLWFKIERASEPKELTQDFVRYCPD